VPKLSLPIVSHGPLLLTDTCNCHLAVLVFEVVEERWPSRQADRADFERGCGGLGESMGIRERVMGRFVLDVKARLTPHQIN
jgi:hypothetical protein